MTNKTDDKDYELVIDEMTQEHDRFSELTCHLTQLYLSIERVLEVVRRDRK